MREYRARNKEGVRKRERRYYESSERRRYALSGRTRLYGLSFDDFTALQTAQQGKCAICERVPNGSLGVDHDHETGVVRGLLCDSCNRGLGFFGDGSARLERAADYLKRHGS